MNISEFTRLMEIIKLCNDGQDADIFAGAGHDQIWFNLPSPDEIGPDELDELDEMGLFYDESIDTWVLFV